ncbi:hypothetical protein YC2023_032070 [Brassica napus]
MLSELAKLMLCLFEKSIVQGKFLIKGCQTKEETINNFQNTKKEEDNVAFGVRKKKSLTSIFLFCSLSVVNVYEVEAAAEEEDDDSSLSRYCDYLNSSLAINLFLEFLLLKISGELSLYLPSDLQLNSKVKHAWAGIVKGWVTYRKVIRDTVQVRSKYKEMSCGDCRTSKHDFRALEKLTHRPSDGIEPRAKRADVSGPLAVGGQGIISGIRTS